MPMLLQPHKQPPPPSLACQLHAHHHHASHPEEQDIVPRLQQGGGVELGKVRGLLRPLEDCGREGRRGGRGVGVGRGVLAARNRSRGRGVGFRDTSESGGGRHMGAQGRGTGARQASRGKPTEAASRIPKGCPRVMHAHVSYRRRGRGQRRTRCPGRPHPAQQAQQGTAGHSMSRGAQAAAASSSWAGMPWLRTKPRKNS